MSLRQRRELNRLMSRISAIENKDEADSVVKFMSESIENKGLGLYWCKEAFFGINQNPAPMNEVVSAVNRALDCKETEKSQYKRFLAHYAEQPRNDIQSFILAQLKKKVRKSLGSTQTKTESATSSTERTSANIRHEESNEFLICGKESCPFTVKTSSVQRMATHCSTHSSRVTSKTVELTFFQWLCRAVAYDIMENFNSCESKMSGQDGWDRIRRVQLFASEGVSRTLTSFLKFSELGNFKFEQVDSYDIITEKNLLNDDMAAQGKRDPERKLFRICKHKDCPYTELEKERKDSRTKHHEIWHSRTKDCDCVENDKYPLTVGLTFIQWFGRVSAMTIRDSVCKTFWDYQWIRHCFFYMQVGQSQGYYRLAGADPEFPDFLKDYRCVNCNSQC